METVQVKLPLYYVTACSSLDIYGRGVLPLFRSVPKAAAFAGGACEIEAIESVAELLAVADEHRARDVDRLTVDPLPDAIIRADQCMTFDDLRMENCGGMIHGEADDHDTN